MDALILVHTKGIIPLEFLPEGETMNANRYIETLEKLRDRIQFGLKWRGRFYVQTVRLLHDNATPHTA